MPGAVNVAIRWRRAGGSATVAAGIGNASAAGLQAAVTAPSAPTITSPAFLVAGTVNTVYPSTTFTASGSTPITWTVTSGTLPTGMAFSSAGVLSGTPTATASGSITFTATNALGADSRALTLTVSAAGSLPLLYEANVTGSGRYLGAFRVPSDGGQANPNNWSGGVGSGAGQYIAYNPSLNSLFISSRNADGGPNIGQISIPASFDTTGNPANMPIASWVGASTSAPYFFDITGGNRGQSFGPGSENPTCAGMFTDGVNIYQSFEDFYDASGTATIAPLWKRAGLGITSGTITGPTSWAGSRTQRTLAGAGCSIPSYWRSALGGDMLQADKQYSINSNQNMGPFLASWDTSQVGVVNPLPNTVLCEKQYPGEGETPLWSNTATCAGLAFPSGTRSVLHIGRYGTGSIYYGNPGIDGPADPVNSYKSWHAYPYRWRIWAYDAEDLASVKAGTKVANSVDPYSTWLVAGPPNTLDAGGSTLSITVGACLDDVNKRLFIAECETSRTGSLQPIIHVFQLSF